MNAQRTAIIFLIFLALACTTVAVVPSLRLKAKALVSSEQRTILAKVEGALGPNGPKVTVLKIESADGLSLEIFENIEDGQASLLAKIRLDEKRDAHFTYQGNATNLAIGDMEGDGTMEIFAPAFDDQMIARLNIYKFNPDTKSFDRINSSQSESNISK